MSGISVQVSLYPLGRDSYAPVIHEFIHAIAASGLHYEVGAMSTLVLGDDRDVFAALHAAFAQAAALGPMVMTVTVSNACPVSAPSIEEAPS